MTSAFTGERHSIKTIKRKIFKLKNIKTANSRKVKKKRKKKNSLKIVATAAVAVAPSNGMHITRTSTTPHRPKEETGT